MNINITLLFQVLNFGIAYWLLRFGLFKPVVSLLRHGQQAHDELEVQIATATQQVHDARNQLYVHQHAMMQTLAHHYPLEHAKQIFEFNDLSFSADQCKPTIQEVDALRADIMRNVRDRVLS